jgi:hypothetical protein
MTSTSPHCNAARPASHARQISNARYAKKYIAATDTATAARIPWNNPKPNRTKIMVNTIGNITGHASATAEMVVMANNSTMLNR